MIIVYWNFLEGSKHVYPFTPPPLPGSLTASPLKKLDSWKTILSFLRLGQFSGSSCYTSRSIPKISLSFEIWTHLSFVLFDGNFQKGLEFITSPSSEMTSSFIYLQIAQPKFNKNTPTITLPACPSLLQKKNITPKK